MATTLFNEVCIGLNPSFKKEDFFKLTKITHRFERDGKTLHHNPLTCYQYWRGDGDSCAHVNIYREVAFNPSINSVISEAKKLAKKYTKVRNAFMWLSDNPQFDEWDIKNRNVGIGKSCINWDLWQVQYLAEWLTVAHKEIAVSSEPKQWIKKFE